MGRALRLLHSSDWHLGRRLHGRARYEEFAAFLHWLGERIDERAVDVLIVAGDVFDTTAPSNRAQQLYYRFLCRVAASGCRHVVIVAGNHDSPSFLEAPRELLEALQVHVVGNPSAEVADDLLLLEDDDGAAQMIVCAVPFLRDRDLRSVAPGESVEDKERKLLAGIRAHYAAMAQAGEALRRSLPVEVPLVATGHLFASGAVTVDGDGVRDLYVGSLAHVSAAVFPTAFDYVALGHLHVPQRVGDCEHIRYCGSPLPMGFGEATQEKCVLEIEFQGRGPQVTALALPCFQALRRIRGDLPALQAQLRELLEEGRSIWLEVTYDGTPLGDLRERLGEIVGDGPLEILRLRNTQMVERVLGRMSVEETLDDIEPEDVFLRLLDAQEVPDAQRPALLHSHREVLQSLHDNEPGPE